MNINKATLYRWHLFKIMFLLSPGDVVLSHLEVKGAVRVESTARVPGDTVPRPKYLQIKQRRLRNLLLSHFLCLLAGRGMDLRH